MECAAAGFWEPPTAIPMDATEVYLPGNRFEILKNHSFIGRKNLFFQYQVHFQLLLLWSVLI